MLAIMIVVAIGCRRRPNSAERVYENWTIINMVQRARMRRPPPPPDIENNAYDNAAMANEAAEAPPDAEETSPMPNGHRPALVMY